MLNPDDSEILAEFLVNMLTDEVGQMSPIAWKHMEQSHSEAQLALKDVKKLMPKIPTSAFLLLLQAMIQPMILLKNHWA